MKQKQKHNAKGRAAKSVLRLPDLEVAKSAVLNSLSCPDAQRGYRHAVPDWVTGLLNDRIGIEPKAEASAPEELPTIGPSGTSLARYFFASGAAVAGRSEL